jgi:hypothetical protein
VLKINTGDYQLFIKSQLNILLIIILFIFLIQGCDLFESSDENYLSRGTCRINIEGYFNKSFSGQAVYENVPTGRGKTLFILSLNDIVEPGIDYRYVEFQGGVKPVVGTHNIINIENNNDSTKGILIGSYNDSEIAESFHSIGGTITINNAKDNILKGRADFTAVSNVSLGNGQSVRAEIRVTTEFFAEEAHTGIIIN